MAKRQKKARKVLRSLHSAHQASSELDDGSSMNVDSQTSSCSNDKFENQKDDPSSPADDVSLGGWSLGSNLYFSDTGSGIKFSGSQGQGGEDSPSLNSQVSPRKTRSGSSAATGQNLTNRRGLKKLTPSSDDVLLSASDGVSISPQQILEDEAKNQCKKKKIESQKSKNKLVVDSLSDKDSISQELDISDVVLCKSAVAKSSSRDSSSNMKRSGTILSLSASRDSSSNTKRSGTILKSKRSLQKPLRNDELSPSVDSCELTPDPMAVKQFNTARAKDQSLDAGRRKSTQTTKRKRTRVGSDARSSGNERLKSSAELQGTEEDKPKKKRMAKPRNAEAGSDEVGLNIDKIERIASPNLFDYESESSDAFYSDRGKIETFKPRLGEIPPEKKRIAAKPLDNKSLDATEEMSDDLEDDTCRPSSESKSSDSQSKVEKPTAKHSGKNERNLPAKVYKNKIKSGGNSARNRIGQDEKNSSEDEGERSRMPSLFEDLCDDHLESSSSISSSAKKKPRLRQSSVSFADSAVGVSPLPFLPPRTLRQQLKTSTPMEQCRNVANLVKLEFGRNAKSRKSLRDSGNFSNFHFDSSGSVLSPVQSEPSPGWGKGRKREKDSHDKFSVPFGQAAKGQGCNQDLSNVDQRKENCRKNDSANPRSTKKDVEPKLVEARYGKGSKKTTFGEQWKKGDEGFSGKNNEPKLVEITDEYNTKKPSVKGHKKTEQQTTKKKANVTKSKVKGHSEEHEIADEAKSSNIVMFADDDVSSRGNSAPKPRKPSTKNAARVNTKSVAASIDDKLLQELDEIDRNYSLVIGDESAGRCFS